MRYYDELGNDVTGNVEDLESKLAVANQVIEALQAKLHAHKEEADSLKVQIKKRHTPKKPKPTG